MRELPRVRQVLVPELPVQRVLLVQEPEQELELALGPGLALFQVRLMVLVLKLERGWGLPERAIR